jgi:threonine/homoserine/homoserine lactone efflux protein
LNDAKIGLALASGQHFDKFALRRAKSMLSKWSQLMTLTGFLAYSAALAVAVAVPGPGIVAMVARGLGSGFRAALPFTLGIALGDLVYLTAAVLGLAFIAQSFGMVFLTLKYAGAAYLIYLAYKFWTSGAGFDRVEARRAEGPLASFLSGLMVTLGNPKVMVFYLALICPPLPSRITSCWWSSLQSFFWRSFCPILRLPTELARFYRRRRP